MTLKQREWAALIIEQGELPKCFKQKKTSVQKIMNLEENIPPT